jgi:fucose 4-O-acetylase-like acetyltransferase
MELHQRCEKKVSAITYKPELENISRGENRLHYIDSAKGIGILLVIIGHHLLGAEWIVDWINSFHMPLFFVITGVLTGCHEDKRSTKQLLYKKAKSLMYPYVTFSLLNLIWYLLYYVALSFEPEESLSVVIIKMITTYGYQALWFLPAMFFASIIAKQTGEGKHRWLLGSIYMLTGCLLAVLIENVQMASVCRYALIYIGRICIGVTFIYIGSFWHRIVVHLNQPKQWIVLAIAGGISCFGSVVSNNLAVVRIGNPIVYYTLSCAGSIFILLLCRSTVLGRSNILGWLGKNSLIIMALHMGFPIEIAWIILGMCGITEMANATVCSVCAITIELMILCASIYLINRYFPFFVYLNKKRCEKNNGA